MNSNSSGGFLLGLLTIAFVVLKLLGVISWSWFWVLSPTLIPLAILAVITVVMLIGWAISASTQK